MWSAGARDTEHLVVLDDLLSALDHELHPAEVSEGGPAALDVRPVEELEAVGVGNRTEPCDRARGARVEDHVGAATLFHVVLCELSSDPGKRRVWFAHGAQCALASEARGDRMRPPIRFVAPRR